MKKGIPLLIGIVGSLTISCQGMLDLEHKENSAPVPRNRDFNFMYRLKSTDTTSTFQDSLGVERRVLVELYLLPFDTLAQDRPYSISYRINEQMDADLTYGNRKYRANDVIPVQYREFVKQKLYMSLIPLNNGRMDLSVTCTDESGKSKNYRRAYVVLP